MIPCSELMVESALDTRIAETPFRAFLEIRQAVRSRLRHRTPNQPPAIFPCFDPHVSRQHLQRRLSDINRAINTHRLQTFSAKKTSGAMDPILSQRLSASSKESGAWMFADTRIRFLINPDEPARDDLLRRLGLDPAVPSKCSLCPYVFTVDSGPFDHATGCAHSKVNRTAGALVEQAVYRGIKSMEPGASRTPVIRPHPLFVETNSNPKLEADI